MEIVSLPHNTHTTTATTERGLNDNWIAVFIDELFGVLEILHRSVGTWHDRYTLLYGCGTSRNLVTESLDYLRRGTDEDDPVLFDFPGEFRVLRKEAVSCSTSATGPVSLD